MCTDPPRAMFLESVPVGNRRALPGCGYRPRMSGRWSLVTVSGRRAQSCRSKTRTSREMTRILVIDDEPAIADVLRMLLEFRGHDVFVANDGSRGYATAQRQAPDVIVLDLMMPVMDGFATLEALRSDERTVDIPVVVLSALSSGEMKQRCQALGVRAILQ